MRARTLLRFIPGLLAALLIALAFAPARSVRATNAGAGTPTLNNSCDQVLQSGGSNGLVTIGPSGGVTQPLGMQANVAACSLAFQNVYDDDGTFRVVGWNPLTLAPDPTSIALRTIAFSASALTANHMALSFSPPIVTRRIDHLAEPPVDQIAFDFRLNDGIWQSSSLHQQTDGAPDVPTGYSYAANGVRTALPGSNGVLAHQVCGGDKQLQQYQVVQSVMRTDVLLSTSPYEWVQKFRVPVSTTLQWVELAFGSVQAFGQPNGAIAIFDADGQVTPPQTWPAPLVQADFVYDTYGSMPIGWNSHFDFDHIIHLEAEHDYWLVARTVAFYKVYARNLTGAEGPDFSSRIGPLLSRPTGGSPWTLEPNRALDFRLIGQPSVTVGVSPPSLARSDLELRVAPNPVRGITFVRWSGAQGPVRFVIVDERGRRVSTGASDAPEGRWQWTARADNGSALPAGVYFVRAEDATGRRVSQRFVLVR
jgi:hypothetical protein